MVLEARPSGGNSADAENVGTAGVGVFKQKLNGKLQFKKLNLGSNKISITDDTPNDEVDIDVVQGNIDHGSLAGLGDDDHTIYVKGPASATDNAIVRFDSTTGKLVKNSNVTIDDSGNVVSPASIMSLYYSAASEGESTSTTGWAAKLSMTNTYVAGTYKLEWYYEQRVSNTNTTVGCRVQDTTAAATYAETGSNDINYHGMGGVYVFTIAAGSRTIEIQFQRSAGNGTAYIRRARLYMIRVA